MHIKIESINKNNKISIRMFQVDLVDTQNRNMRANTLREERMCEYNTENPNEYYFQSEYTPQCNQCASALFFLCGFPIRTYYINRRYETKFFTLIRFYLHIGLFTFFILIGYSSSKLNFGLSIHFRSHFLCYFILRFTRFFLSFFVRSFIRLVFSLSKNHWEKTFFLLDTFNELNTTIANWTLSFSENEWLNKNMCIVYTYTEPSEFEQWAYM